MFAIIDIETTGGSPVTEKITEIAIFLHDGEQVVDEYCTLINPEKKIPYHITSLTGISNAMVADAPKFYEVAKKIVELTEGSIFIAHNVNFDYEFIRNEFKRLGYTYSRDKLCTVQLSRRLIPGLPSYSLGKICHELGIHIHGRHRAGGDAYATVKLFEKLLHVSKDKDKSISSYNELNTKHLNPNLNASLLKTLPEEAGTYYFFNDQQELIYIGKSKNIRSRVYTHFRNYSTKKSIEMLHNIADIDYEVTGSELVALLKESEEIKKHRPLYNRAQRRAISTYGLYTYIDQNGYIRFTLDKNDSKKEELPLRSFSGLKVAKTYLLSLVENHELCQKLCGLYPGSGSCFSYEIASCNGACIGKESPEDYNKRAKLIIRKHSFRHDSFFILDSGKSLDETAVIQIEHGKYIGYGFLDSALADGNPANLSACISRFEDNRDVQQILRNHLSQHPELKILPFSPEISG
ncbi:MAG: GIY-YIG nuclease family protein [Bacteroidales bacterium]|nr:GIY-YIG nuclease family protein [Bacteroidales bacterium]